MNNTTASVTPDIGAWDLVAAAQAGDQAAFGQLYERYWPVVSKFLWHRLLDWYLVEDLTAETFTRALRRIDTVSDVGRDVGAWFVTIARNLLIDHAKCSRTKLETVAKDSTISEFTVVDKESDPARIVPRNELRDILERAQAQLVSAAQHQVVELRFWSGLSVTETAQAMGITEGAAKALQHRAVVRLRELIGPELLNVLRED